jgi:hypothetical protein
MFLPEVKSRETRERYLLNIKLGVFSTGLDAVAGRKNPYPYLKENLTHPDY